MPVEDLETSAIVGVTSPRHGQGRHHDDSTHHARCRQQLEAVAALTEDAVAVIEEVVADKGYHSRTIVHDLETLAIRTYISEPDR